MLPEEEDAPLTLHGSLSHNTTLIISLTPAGEPFARLAGVFVTHSGGETDPPRVPPPFRSEVWVQDYNSSLTSALTEPQHS